jgi:hypothetical protein
VALIFWSFLIKQKGLKKSPGGKTLIFWLLLYQDKSNKENTLFDQVADPPIFLAGRNEVEAPFYGVVLYWG